MQSERPDEDARRAYWTEQMEAACAHMAAVSDYPVDECGQAMDSLPDAADEAGVEVAFSTTKVVKNFDRLFYLREGLIDDFVAIARRMNARGWVLKVEDAYRTCAIQKHLAMKEELFSAVLERLRWEFKGRMPSPEEMSRRLSAFVAASPKIGPHTSGSALDISVLNRDDGTEIDRGGPYLELSELMPMGSPFISSQARRNRHEITATMSENGFPPYPYEFWHYSKGDGHSEYLSGAGKPARYGPVNVDLVTGKTTPVENPNDPLNSIEEIRSEIQRALARLEDR
ncbi:MAG: M15 family metallopeptidase [Planctomycetota bacterium]|nr:M15 family metallopeptidase [Planctomycetota bacterium]